MFQKESHHQWLGHKITKYVCDMIFNIVFSKGTSSFMWLHKIVQSEIWI